MSTPEYCVYNETRNHLLAPRVAALDTRTDPLKAVKVLIEGLAPNAATGLWLNPLKSIPAVPRLSAYDLVYLDHEGHVVHGVELVPDDEPPRVQGLAVSALLLPIHSFAASRAMPGDRFVFRRADEVPAVATVAETQSIAPTVRPSSPLNAPASRAAIEKIPLETLRPLSWQPASFESFVPSVALEPVDPHASHAIEPSSRPASRFGLLRSLANVRIRVHISISAAPEMPVRVASPGPSQKRFQKSLQPVVRQLSQLPANALIAVRPHIAKGASSLRRQCAAGKAAYVRWADSFIFRPAKPSSGLSSIPDTPLLPPPMSSIRKPRFLR
jgi:hypothetical protein